MGPAILGPAEANRMKNLNTILHRSLIAAFLLSGSVAAVQAQEDKLKLKVRMSADPQAEDKRQPRSLFRMGPTNLMVMRVRDEGAGVQPFDRMSPKFEIYGRDKLGVTRSQEPTLKVKAGMLFLEDLVLFGGQPIMIAARRDTIQGRVELYWQKLDPNLTRLHPPFEPLCQFDALVKGTGQVIPAGSAFRDPFFTTFSPDTNLMLVHAPVVEGTDGKVRHLMVVVDRGMDVRWKRTMDLPPNQRFEDVQLDNMGNVYLVSRLPAKVADAKKDSSSYKLDLTLVNGDGMTPCETGLKDRYIKSLRFRALDDGRIAIGGIHGGLNPKGEATLVNFIAYLPPGQAKVDITSSWMIDYDSEDAWMAKGMRVLDLLPRRDGGFFLVNEYYLQTDKPETKLALSGLRWVHGPMQVYSLDAKGEEEWSTVYRRLHVANDLRIGHPFLLVHEDQLLIFLLDSEPLAARRKSKTKEQSHLDMKQPYSAYVLFAADGSERTKAVLRSSGANDFIQGTQLFHVGKGEYYVLGSSKLGGSKLLPVKIELGQ